MYYNSKKQCPKLRMITYQEQIIDQCCTMIASKNLSTYLCQCYHITSPPLCKGKIKWRKEKEHYILTQTCFSFCIINVACHEIGALIPIGNRPRITFPRTTFYMDNGCHCQLERAPLSFDGSQMSPSAALPIKHMETWQAVSY